MNNMLRVGSVVKVTRKETVSQKNAEWQRYIPTIGRIVFIGSGRKFYIVEFRDRYTVEYKPMYRQSFWPEQLERIHCPNFTKPRPAKKRAWAK